MRTTLCSLLSAFLIVSVLSNLAFGESQKTKLVSLSYVSYPPYYDEQLPLGGPLTEIIEAAFKLEGYQVKREMLPWSRAIKWTEKGNYDALYTAWYREEREQSFAFSDPLPGNELVLFKLKKSNISYKEYKDLAPYSIGVVRDYANPPSFDGAGLNLAPVTSDKQNILKLADERIDLALSDKALGKFIMRTELKPEKADKIDWLEPPLIIEPQYLMFSRQAKDYQVKLKAFNTGLKKLTDSGELDRIIKKHGL